MFSSPRACRADGLQAVLRRWLNEWNSRMPMVRDRYFYVKTAGSVNISRKTCNWELALTLFSRVGSNKIL
jgi:hypothetical protein